MRSKAYYLFVLLTSIVLNLANACAIPNKADDCLDKKTLSTVDVKWNFDTAFNDMKHTPMEKREFVEVDFNRALYLDGGTGVVEFHTNDKDICKNVLIRNNNRNTLKDQAAFTKNGDTYSFTTNVPSGTYVAVFHPECRLRVKISDLKQNSLNAKHIFTNNVETDTWNEGSWHIDLMDSSGANKPITKKLGNYIVARHKDEGNVHEDIKEFNNFFPFLHNNHEGNKQECHHLCKQGYLFEFNTVTGLDFANTFKVSQTCQWMTIFLNADKNGMPGAEISFRHGFVTLPKEVKAFPMDFESYGTTHAYEVSVLYYYDGDKKNIPNLRIANSHGEAVHSTIVFPSTRKIFFGFSGENCLASVIGQEMIPDPSDSSKDRMQEHDFLNTLNLGIMVARYGYTAYSYVENPSSNALKKLDMTNTAIKDWVTEYCYDATEPKDKNGIDSTGKVDGTVPAATLNPSHTTSFLTHVTPFHFAPEDDKALADILAEKERREAELLRIMNSKYYYYWAIPAGFGAGSIASFIICNIIMFLMRRSVCTFWYKAMYKRYGSDTTMGAGTTMGKTGGGETIGGGTTAGGTTAGGTTAGETVGSTTAA